MRDVLEPLMARFGREFPGYDPYPFGARRYVEQLVLGICFAEPLTGEFAACFADASDDELVALGMSFAFGNCIEQKILCEIVSRLPPGGASPRLEPMPLAENTEVEGDHGFKRVCPYQGRPLLVRDMDCWLARSRRVRLGGAPADAGRPGGPQARGTRCLRC
jgi:hypothetical protein